MIDSVYDKLNYAVTFETLINFVGDDPRYKNIVEVDPKEGILLLEKNLEPLKAGHRRSTTHLHSNTAFNTNAYCILPEVKQCEESFKELLKEMEDLHSKSSWTEVRKYIPRIEFFHYFINGVRIVRRAKSWRNGKTVGGTEIF